VLLVSGPQQHLDRAAFVHRSVALGDLVERYGDIEHLAGIDLAVPDEVDELSTQSAEFRTRWAAHNARFHDTGIKESHHPIVGDITLIYITLDA
jgi:hypothetical protein